MFRAPMSISKPRQHTTPKNLNESKITEPTVNTNTQFYKTTQFFNVLRFWHAQHNCFREVRDRVQPCLSQFKPSKCVTVFPTLATSLVSGDSKCGGQCVVQFPSSRFCEVSFGPHRVIPPSERVRDGDKRKFKKRPRSRSMRMRLDETTQNVFKCAVLNG